MLVSRSFYVVFHPMYIAAEYQKLLSGGLELVPSRENSYAR